MRAVSFLVALFGSATAVSAASLPVRATTSGGFTKANPGPIKNMVITKETTINGTYTGNTTIITKPDSKFKEADVTAESTLSFDFVNNFGADINAYFTGTDPNNNAVFILQDGSVVTPSSGGSATPVPITENIAIPIAAGATISMTLPSALSSSRIYFAAGTLAFSVVGTTNGEGIVQPAPNNPTDPSSGVNWGFIEFTLNTDGSVYANISYVDFVGMPLGMSLAVNGGDTQTAFGVGAGSVATICSNLQGQASSDGRPWDQMCIAGADGTPVRALSMTQFTGASAFDDYWNTYIDSVWTQYSSQDLVMAGYNCRVTNDVMTCDGDDGNFPRPTAGDIWGCASGTFANAGSAEHLAVLPVFCAAFHRATLLLDGGATQPSLPSTSYYTVDPNNHYSQFVHQVEVDGKGYAFPYDDVNPGGENASGTVSSGTPGTLTIYIGAPPS